MQVSVSSPVAQAREDEGRSTHSLAEYALAHILQCREEDLDRRVRQLRAARLWRVEPRLRGLAARGTVELVHPLCAVCPDRRSLCGKSASPEVHSVKRQIQAHLAFKHELSALLSRRAHVAQNLHERGVAGKNDLRYR